MEDGVLSLKIYCGKPYELDDEQTIVIHWNNFVKSSSSFSSTTPKSPPTHSLSLLCIRSCFDSALLEVLGLKVWCRSVKRVVSFKNLSSLLAPRSSNLLQRFKHFQHQDPKAILQAPSRFLIQDLINCLLSSLKLSQVHPPHESIVL